MSSQCNVPIKHSVDFRYTSCVDKLLKCCRGFQIWYLRVQPFVNYFLDLQMSTT